MRKCSKNSFSGSKRASNIKKTIKLIIICYQMHCCVYCSLESFFLSFVSEIARANWSRSTCVLREMLPSVIYDALDHVIRIFSCQ